MFATCGTERCDLAEDVTIKNKESEISGSMLQHSLIFFSRAAAGMRE